MTGNQLQSYACIQHPHTNSVVRRYDVACQLCSLQFSGCLISILYRFLVVNPKSCGNLLRTLLNITALLKQHSHATAAAQTVLPHLTVLAKVLRAALTGPIPANALARAQVLLTEAACFCTAGDVAGRGKGSALARSHCFSIGLCTLDCSDAVPTCDHTVSFKRYI